ncbi:MAG: hypothetical protein ACD_23C00501G0001 [uncultured bacterium]|nr:MAG: hypothetical protein ACD_23C00501G0001 [uncultured bacterium]
MRQKRILLPLVEAMHLVDKHQRAPPLLLGQLRFLHRFADVLDPAQHGTDGDELGVERVGHETGDGGFSGAWRSPENTAVGLARLKRQAQRHAFAQQMSLPHHFGQGFGAQAFSQGRRA